MHLCKVTIIENGQSMDKMYILLPFINIAVYLRIYVFPELMVASSMVCTFDCLFNLLGFECVIGLYVALRFLQMFKWFILQSYDKSIHRIHHIM